MKLTTKLHLVLALAVAISTSLFVSACSTNTGHEGTHQMGSAPMSNEKMPGGHQNR